MSSEEEQRQAAILGAIRLEQHHLLAVSGTAERIMRATVQLNMRSSITLLSELSLTYVSRIPVRYLAPNTLTADAPKAYTNMVGGSDTRGWYMLRMGKYDASKISSSIIQFGVGIQAGERVFPLGDITEEDAGLVSRLVGALAIVRQNENLTCLNDELLNNQLTSPRLAPIL